MVWDKFKNFRKDPRKIKTLGSWFLKNFLIFVRRVKFVYNRDSLNFERINGGK